MQRSETSRCCVWLQLLDCAGSLKGFLNSMDPLTVTLSSSVVEQDCDALRGYGLRENMLYC